MLRVSRSPVLLVLAVMATAGCAPGFVPLGPGGGTPRQTVAAAVQLDHAPSTATARVALDGPVGSTGLFEPAAWPRACALLDDGGIRAVLPQTGRTVREPQSGEMTVFGVGRATDVQIPEASCKIGIELPDKDFSALGGFNEYSISVDIHVAGKPAMVTKNLRKADSSNLPTVIDGINCLKRVSAQQLTCATPQVEFSVSRGSFGIPNPIDQEAVIRYVHDGRTEVFRRDGGVPEVERRNQYETDVVLPEFARVILRNLGA